MSYKTIDGLMKHLRNNGIPISGSSQKIKLINTGYFHGYKGYRFFKDKTHKIQYISYEEVYSTIQYDTKLKALFYDKIMFIETAVKNIALICILDIVGSENINDMLDKVVSSYNNSATETDTKKKEILQLNKLKLQGMLQRYIFNGYKEDNPKIKHFFSNDYNGNVPIWSLFEVMTMGDFGYLLSCLDFNTRDHISKRLGINLSSDTNRTLVYKYIYSLKELRNAIAHNAVIFDVRFNNIGHNKSNKPTKPMIQCLKQEIGLPYVNFKTIDDYLILVCYYLKLLHISKTEIKSFIKSYKNIVENYKKTVNFNVANDVIHPDFERKINILKNYI